MSEPIPLPPAQSAGRRVRAVWVWGQRHATALAAVAIVLLVAWAVGRLVTRLERRVQDPRRCAAFVSKDSGHYVEIARGFNGGDWRMRYVTTRAHRQPLYPLLLAVPMKWAPPGVFWLAMVNVVVFTLLMVSVFLLVTALFESRLAGLAAAGFLAADQFLFDNITARLLTEPLFVLLAFLSTAAFLAYAQRRQPRLLLLAAVTSGLSYLVRPNGLFLAFTLAAVLGVDDLVELIRRWRTGPALAAGARGRELARLVGRYALFGVVFAAVTVPSWAPRWAYCGAPLAHKYLSNFMWADTYAAAHGQDPARFTPGEYFANHGAGEVVRRLARGLKAVYWDAATDRALDGNTLLFAVALVGLGLSLAARCRPYWLLGAFMFLQMLPLAWANLANPTLRIPYTALLPFALLFAAYAVHRAWDAAARRLAARQAAA